VSTLSKMELENVGKAPNTVANLRAVSLLPLAGRTKEWTKGDIEKLLFPVANQNEDGTFMPIGTSMEGYDKDVLGPKRVLVSVYLRDIFQVDAVAETWTALIDVNCEWLDDGALKEDVSAGYAQGGRIFAVAPEELWRPHLGLVNGVDGLEPIKDSIDVCLLNGRHVISSYNTFRATLPSPSDLRQFPFDCPKLTLSLGSEMWLVSDLLIIPENGCLSPSQLKHLVVDSMVDSQAEYKVLGVVARPGEHVYANLTRFDFQEEGYPEVTFEFQMLRDPKYYLRNIAVIVNILVFVTLLTYILDPSDIGSRMSLTTTMLLTLVAFQFVATGMLPRISYSTRLDQWLNVSFCNILFMNIQNVIMVRLSMNAPEWCQAHCLSLDMACLAGSLFVLLASNAIFMSPWWSSRYRAMQDVRGAPNVVSPASKAVNI